MNDYSMKALKGGIREYIDILISIYYIYDNIDNIDNLKKIYNKLDGINNYKDLEIIKKDIITIQDNTEIDLEKKIVNENSLFIDELSVRENDLINRGYSRELVLDLCSYNQEQLEKIVDIILYDISKNCKTVSNPLCIFIGGQPGCGKSTNSLKLKESFSTEGAVEIGIDNYRSYHPNYLRIEDAIREHWKNRKITSNDSPGNDIADFTHRFASEVTDCLVDILINKNKKYNLIIEWGMRTPDEPLKMMKILKEKGYKNIINFVVVDEKSSYNACIIRADSMDGLKHIVRRIPKYFHDLCVKTLPNSCNKIYKEGFIKNNYIDHFILISRDGNTIWNDSFVEEPINTYKEYLYKEKI